MSVRRGSFVVRTPADKVGLVKQRMRSAWLQAQNLKDQPWRQLVREWFERSRRAFKFYTASALLHAVPLALLALIILRSERQGGSDEIHAEIVRAGLADLSPGAADKGLSLNVQFVDSQLGDLSPDIADEGVAESVAALGLQSGGDDNAFSGAATASALSTSFDSSMRTAARRDSRLPLALSEHVAPAGGGSRDNRRRGASNSNEADADAAGLERLKSQFDGRSATSRPGLVKGHGGNDASEAAVAAGLNWLAAHQRADGSWNFNHVTGKCDATCTYPGTPQLFDCEIGATGLALLAFLGAGQTHYEGRYQKQVAAGLDYLIKDLPAGPAGYGIDLRDGSLPTGQMYVHAIATMALSEAYAMTSDRRLIEPAQGGVDFIAWSQDPFGGGWRYQPQAPGDTSVVGWQVMALTSARVAGLNVPRTTIPGALHFLTSVQAPGDGGYGYKNARPRPSTTAIGLLCKMYLQTNATRESFQRGAQALAELGPSRDDIYYNYYATQFMHQYGRPLWNDWNEKMRDWLILTQDKDGHAAGSWAPHDRHGLEGGRVYMTAMAVMTLEVYYRHLPLYEHGVEFQPEPAAADAGDSDRGLDRADDVGLPPQTRAE
jgi:hypothetical protein